MRTHYTHCHLIRAVHHLACFKVRIPSHQFQLSVPTAHLTVCLGLASLDCEDLPHANRVSVGPTEILICGASYSKGKYFLPSLCIFPLFLWFYLFTPSGSRRGLEGNMRLGIPCVTWACRFPPFHTPPARGDPEEPLFTGSCCGQGGGAGNLVLGGRKPGEAKDSSFYSSVQTKLPRRSVPRRLILCSGLITFSLSLVPAHVNPRDPSWHPLPPPACIQTSSPMGEIRKRWELPWENMAWRVGLTLAKFLWCNSFETKSFTSLLTPYIRRVFP